MTSCSGKKVFVFCGDVWSCLFSMCQYAIILLLKILTLLFLQMGASKNSNSTSFGDIEDLIHSFLIIMLEHSMRHKDGWKVISSNLWPLLPLWNFSGLLYILISLLCIIISMLIPCLFVQWFVEHIMLFVAFDWMPALEPSFSYQVKLKLNLGGSWYEIPVFLWNIGSLCKSTEVSNFTESCGSN